MKEDKLIVNGKRHIVTIETLQDKEITTLTWVNVAMHTAAYDLYILNLVSKSNMAVKITVYLGICLSKSSPFIPMTQKLLAEKLGTSEGNISTAMKILLQDDVVIKVNSEVFALNPAYIFKCRFEDRELWLRILEGEGYQETYKAYKASEYFTRLQEKYK